jgi:hypothetical protein
MGGKPPCGAIGCANTRLPPMRAPPATPTGALPRTPPKGLSPFGIPQYGVFLWVEQFVFPTVLAASWRQTPVCFDERSEETPKEQ